MRLRRLVADSLKRLVQLLHSAWSRQLSPENWCLGVENGLFPEFGGHFWVFLAILGRKPGTFPHFLWSRHPSAGTLRFWGHSSFVERYASPDANPPRVSGTVEAVVGHHLIAPPKSLESRQCPFSIVNSILFHSAPTFAYPRFGSK